MSLTGRQGYLRCDTWAITDNRDDADFYRSFHRNDHPWHQRWQIRFEEYDWVGGETYSAHGFMIPYATIVIPLTALSTGLLLSKPRNNFKARA